MDAAGHFLVRLPFGWVVYVLIFRQGSEGHCPHSGSQVTKFIVGARPWPGHELGLTPREDWVLTAKVLFEPEDLLIGQQLLLRLVPLPGDPASGMAGLLFASALLAVPLAAHVARIAHSGRRGSV